MVYCHQTCRSRPAIMKIAFGCDHGGFAIKAIIINELRAAGHEVLDCGAFTYDPVDDYPDFATAVGRAIQEGRAERGIVVCGSGVGAAIAGNKLRGIRSCVCHDTYSARQGVAHDDMNVLCLGARVIGDELAKELVRTFVNAKFSGEARHLRRLEKVLALEQNKPGE